MFRKRLFSIAIPYALSGLALLAVGACVPSPAATVTPPPTATPGVTIVIETLAPKTPDNTATAVPPTDTLAPTDVTPATPAPTVTISGTMISQGVSNAKAINAAAPASVGPFTLVKPSSVAYQYGSTLYYRTEDGALYTIILFLTSSATDAVTRYSAELAGVANPQPLKLGDEAVYSMVDTKVLALIHYRNVIIDIYRPDPTGTVPTVKLTDDQVKQLATDMFQLVPKQ